MEPLECGPCKRCEKRALDMESSLLKGYVEKRKKDCCQPPKEGGYQQRVNQASPMGPINSGQSNGSWGELSVTTDKPFVEDNVVDSIVV